MACLKMSVETGQNTIRVWWKVPSFDLDFIVNTAQLIIIQLTNQRSCEVLRECSICAATVEICSANFCGIRGSSGFFISLWRVCLLLHAVATKSADNSIKVVTNFKPNRAICSSNALKTDSMLTRIMRLKPKLSFYSQWKWIPESLWSLMKRVWWATLRTISEKTVEIVSLKQ